MRTFQDVVEEVSKVMLSRGERRHRLRIELEQSEGNTTTIYRFTIDGGGWEGPHVATKAPDGSEVGP